MASGMLASQSTRCICAYGTLEKVLSPLLFGVAFDTKHETTAVNAIIAIIRNNHLEHLYPDLRIKTRYHGQEALPCNISERWIENEYGYRLGINDLWNLKNRLLIW